jgi:hypothetical protein
MKKHTDPSMYLPINIQEKNAHFCLTVDFLFKLINKWTDAFVLLLSKCKLGIDLTLLPLSTSCGSNSNGVQTEQVKQIETVHYQKASVLRKSFMCPFYQSVNRIIHTMQKKDNIGKTSLSDSYLGIHVFLMLVSTKYCLQQLKRGIFIIF